MTGALIGAVVIAAVVAVWWRRFRQSQTERRQPGATISLPIVVRGFDEIDAELEDRRCRCGAPLALMGETSRQLRQHRYRIVRMLCPECDREYQVYFDVTTVFH
jgi:hypothetical protein